MAEILSEVELNHILATLRTSPLEWVGNEEWTKQMSQLEQLNVQAAYEASQGGEELVRDALVESEKMSTLVHELILLELWRKEVLPRLMKLGTPQTSFQIYMVLFNEANVCNILDTTLFGQDACEALNDSAIDLVDYVIRILTHLCSGEVSAPKSNDFKEALSSWKPGQDLPHFPEESTTDEICRLEQEILFQIAMKCISIMRYLSDHLDFLVLGVSTRLTITQDIPMLLVQLLKSKPWYRRENNQVFQGSEWVEEDMEAMPKLEAQTWIALYNMLSKKSCSDKYELHHYRQKVLTSLGGQINACIIHQLPILEPLKDWLVKLQVNSNVASAPEKNLILIESVAEIEKALHNHYDDKYERIAEEQRELFLGETTEAWQSEAAKLLETLESDAARSLLPEKVRRADPVCGHCGANNPSQRCSRCKKVRYCNQDCQVQDWRSKHRFSCSPSES